MIGVHACRYTVMIGKSLGYENRFHTFRFYSLLGQAIKVWSMVPVQIFCPEPIKRNKQHIRPARLPKQSKNNQEKAKKSGELFHV